MGFVIAKPEGVRIPANPNTHKGGALTHPSMKSCRKHMAVMLGSELTSLCVARRVGPTSLLTAPTVGFWREQLTVELARWLSVYRSLPQQSLSSCSRKRAWISILQLPLNYSHLKVGHGRSATASPGSCLWVMSVASSAPTGSTSARDSHDSAARLILTSPQDPYSPRAYAGNQGGTWFLGPRPTQFMASCPCSGPDRACRTLS